MQRETFPISKREGNGNLSIAFGYCIWITTKTPTLYRYFMMEAADGNYGARLEYIRHMETVVPVGKIFEMIFEEIDEMNRIAETLDQEYEDRIKNGTENDPDFQARWNADDGTRGHSSIVVLSRTFGDENDPS